MSPRSICPADWLKPGLAALVGFMAPHVICAQSQGTLVTDTPDATVLEVVVVPDPNARPAAVVSNDDVEVVTMCGLDVTMPDHIWTVPIDGQMVGLLGYPDTTLVFLGPRVFMLPWRAPVVASSLGTVIVLLLASVAAAGRSGAFTRGTG